MLIKTISDFRAVSRNGKYAWPGGYPLYFVCDDGEAMCFACAKKERRVLLEALADKQTSRSAGYGPIGDWLVIGVETNWEDDGLFCAHCGEGIESAYGAGELEAEGKQADREHYNAYGPRD